jgi:hypothetical protein
MPDRREILEDAAKRGKYAPLYTHLKKMRSKEWRVTFAEIEALLGFDLPKSARIHRPWWANQGAGGNHSHALAWEMAGWRTAEVDMPGERLIFVRDGQH